MVTVIGLWEPVWMDSERSERRLWKQTMQAFKVDQWIMTPSNGKVFSCPVQYDTIEEALNSVEGKKTFFVPSKTAKGIKLEDYKHPKNAIYVIGSAAENLKKYMTDDDDIVTLYTDGDTDLFGCCFIPIVLYDRFLKME